MKSESLLLTEYISKEINNQTFHHHYYILFDLSKNFEYKINYLEIGCYAGGSACLMLQRKDINVYSIDLGYPIDEKIVNFNIKKLNKYNNYYQYIKGNSNTDNIENIISNIVGGIDILFIDGDHSYNGVINDYNRYSKYVNNGGYIVFDDYNDNLYSPEVKPAVDFLIKNNKNYEIIGTIQNIYGARPSDLKDGNCFIIKKWKK